MNQAQTEKEKIVRFLDTVFKTTKKNHAVIAWSSGIDSTTSLFLLHEVLKPEQITVLHLPYETSHIEEFAEVQKKLCIPQANVHEISIKNVVDALCLTCGILNTDLDLVRKGNYMARVRMIVAYDFAKKLDALVCGTENRTEELLGYYTRFGDEASDIEPIRHLYKNQVYVLARFLGVPDVFLEKKPTAELWEGQTDEGEFGFSYEDADSVLSRYYDLHETVETIEKDYANARAIIAFSKKNEFKKKVPYSLGIA